MDKNIRLISRCVGVLVLMALIPSCSPAAILPAEVMQGSSKDDVAALYGEPSRTQEFILPEAPFFGPQENLINLVPSGTLIEEWVYEIGNEELYIWFSGEGGEPGEDWLVLDLGRYPKDAVY